MILLLLMRSEKTWSSSLRKLIIIKKLKINYKLKEKRKLTTKLKSRDFFPLKIFLMFTSMGGRIGC